ncbi:MAG TPA: CopG family transcriptional regulator [Hyphomicrobiaceae bacterium]|nr:CopG family transcriptional regulator [Hyphomicrobiaceae bacterium]
MRTTLDIDDDVLEIAKQRAKAERKSAGQVISELARQALAAPRERLDFSKVEIVDGIPVLPSRGGIVTKELVDKLIEQSGE